MRRPAHVSRLLAIFAAALGCGGGGGSSSDAAPAEITAGNAETIASDVLAAIVLSSDIPKLITDITPEAVGAQDAQGESLRGVAAAIRTLRAIEVEPPPSLSGGVSLAGGAFDPVTRDCEVSGTVTVSGSVAGPIPTAGDRISASFDDCVVLDDDGEEELPLNGRLDYTVLAFTGDPEDLFSIVLDLALDELVLGDEIANVEIDGDATTVFNNTSPPELLSSVEGAQLRFRIEVEDPEPRVTTLTLRGYETLLSRDTEEDTYEINGDGQVSSTMSPPDPDTDYTGQVAYDITEVLTGDTETEDEENDIEHPGDGLVLVTGDATAMQIDIQNETTVILRLDLDDDGDFEETIETTWTDLGF